MFVNNGVSFTQINKLLESVPTFLGSYIAWNDTGWTVQESNPAGGEIFPPVHTGPGIHPASYTMGTASLFRG